MQQVYDSVIVGGGPAGASCALWLARWPVAAAGRGQRAAGRAGQRQSLRRRLDRGAAGRDRPAGRRQYRCQRARRRRAAASVDRTTDVRPCKGGIEATLAGPGGETTRAPHPGDRLGRARQGPARPSAGRVLAGVLIGPGSPIVAQDYSGLSVAVLGGGDNAFENYVYVRNRGARAVHLFARSVRAQQQWCSAPAARACASAPTGRSRRAQRRRPPVRPDPGVLRLGAAGGLRRRPAPSARRAATFAPTSPRPRPACRHLRHRRGGAPHASLRGDVHGRWRGGGQGHPAALGARRGMSGLAADAWPQYLPDSSSPASGTRVSRPSSCSIR